MLNLNLKLEYLKLPNELINDNDTIRISVTTIPDHQKQEYTFKMNKLDEMQPIFNIKLNPETEKVIFVFRKKTFFSSGTIIASTSLQSYEIRIFEEYSNNKSQRISIYEPMQQNGNLIDNIENRKIVGYMTIKFSVQEQKQKDQKAQPNQPEQKPKDQKVLINQQEQEQKDQKVQPNQQEQKPKDQKVLINQQEQEQKDQKIQPNPQDQKDQKIQPIQQELKPKDQKVQPNQQEQKPKDQKVQPKQQEQKDQKVQSNQQEQKPKDQKVQPKPQEQKDQKVQPKQQEQKPKDQKVQPKPQEQKKKEQIIIQPKPQEQKKKEQIIIQPKPQEQKQKDQKFKFSRQKQTTFTNRSFVNSSKFVKPQIQSRIESLMLSNKNGQPDFLFKERCKN